MLDHKASLFPLHCSISHLLNCSLPKQNIHPNLSYGENNKHTSSYSLCWQWMWIMGLWLDWCAFNDAGVKGQQKIRSKKCLRKIWGWGWGVISFSVFMLTVTLESWALISPFMYLCQCQMLYGPKENASAPYMLDNIDLWQANAGSWVIKIVHTMGC